MGVDGDQTGRIGDSTKHDFPTVMDDAGINTAVMADLTRVRGLLYGPHTNKSRPREQRLLEKIGLLRFG